jgi:hypothetical protein
MQVVSGLGVVVLAVPGVLAVSLAVLVRLRSAWPPPGVP